jgi:RHS repeat-associated protein
VTATAVDERSNLPGPTWPPSALAISLPLTERRLVVLADDPCEAGLPASDPEYAGIYLHARYFDPKLGIFLSPDPSDPTRPGVGLNRYAYGFGNPVSGSDRSGLDWADCNDGSGDTCWYEDDTHYNESLEITAYYDPREGLQHLSDGNIDLLARKIHLANQTKEQVRKEMQADLDEQDALAAAVSTETPVAATVVAGAVENTPITPTHQVSWANVRQVVASEALAIALEAYAKNAPCGKAKQTALRLSAIGHGVAAAKIGGIAVGAGLAAYGLAVETGGVSLLILPEVAMAVGGAAASGHTFKNAFNNWAASDNALCAGE